MSRRLDATGGGSLAGAEEGRGDETRQDGRRPSVLASQAAQVRLGLTVQASGPDTVPCPCHVWVMECRAPALPVPPRARHSVAHPIDHMMPCARVTADCCTAAKGGNSPDSGSSDRRWSFAFASLDRHCHDLGLHIAYALRYPSTVSGTILIQFGIPCPGGNDFVIIPELLFLVFVASFFAVFTHRVFTT